MAETVKLHRRALNRIRLDCLRVKVGRKTGLKCLANISTCAVNPFNARQNLEGQTQMAEDFGHVEELTHVPEHISSRMCINPDQRTSLNVTRKFYSLQQISHHMWPIISCCVQERRSAAASPIRLLWNN